MTWATQDLNEVEAVKDAEAKMISERIKAEAKANRVREESTTKEKVDKEVDDRSEHADLEKETAGTVIFEVDMDEDEQADDIAIIKERKEKKTRIFKKMKGVFDEEEGDLEVKEEEVVEEVEK